ncbi:uncharacterized protein EDB91DRAFT_1272395 [Suillus paluster]|uniref:uncharacterized protein n=1 Tax=Suillus paluster TaxID=48578 RepID=UPI001B86B002|nr:uncharacterized protein EDB91DRAFT_1272395 [Suillus paluster]KAG1722887.1 hypothetical protein EDB91DRAFT_1272395 [Suillus paluster]
MSTSPVSLNIHHNILSTLNKALHRCSPCYTQQHPSDTCQTGNSGAAGVSDLYDIADAIGSMIIDDTEDLKANLVMELARARREKLLAEKSLADCSGPLSLELMASLSKFKSSLFEQKLNQGGYDEILKLAESQLSQADLKLESNGLEVTPAKVAWTPVKLEARVFSDEDKLKAVKYITSPEIWPTFKLIQTTTFTYVSLIFCVRLSQSAQIRNFWHNQAWPKYKAVREWQEHTGGGDGDEDDDGDEVEGESVEDDIALDGTKRKHTSKKKILKKVLDEFEASELFKTIDAIARNDSMVVCSHDINSSVSISNNETPLKKCVCKSILLEANDFSDTTGLLREMMGTMGEHHKRQEKVDETNLQVAKLNMEVTLKHEKREQEEYEQHQADIRAKREEAQRKAQQEEWQQASEFLNHPNPLIRARGERMAERLTAEETEKKA